MGMPKGLNPTEMIQKPKFKWKGNQNQKKKRGQKPGCHNVSVENDTYGTTGIPTTIDGREVVKRAGLGVSTKIVYPGSGREDA